MRWLVLIEDRAAAQCSQCFRTAAAQQGAAMTALNSGILILLFLVVVMLVGVCWYAYRRKDA